MTNDKLIYGLVPGIRFALILDGKGGCKDFSLDELNHWEPGQGKLWVHLERGEEACHSWLSIRSKLDPTIVEAMLAEETRPRVESFDDSMLVILRGVNHSGRGDPVDLVPLELWVDADRVISVRNTGHLLTGLRDIRESLAGGHGPAGIGALFAQIAEKIVKHVEPLVDETEDDIDELDEILVDTPRAEARRTLSGIRRDATKLRRYLAPQREALYRLQHEDPSWLAKRDMIRLRETTDRLLRFIESLDSVRDRATILHEDLTSLISEQIAKNSHRLTAVAALLLPPSLVAGIFGMNLGGLPGNSHPWGFALACLGMLGLVPVQYLLMRRFGWI